MSFSVPSNDDAIYDEVDEAAGNKFAMAAMKVSAQTILLTLVARLQCKPIQTLKNSSLCCLFL